jgi:hypothetical protein
MLWNIFSWCPNFSWNISNNQLMFLTVLWNISLLNGKGPIPYCTCFLRWLVDVSFVQYLFVLVSRGFNRICFGWKIKPQDGLNPYRDQVEGRGFTQSLSGLNTPRDFTPPSRTKPKRVTPNSGKFGESAMEKEWRTRGGVTWRTVVGVKA